MFCEAGQACIPLTENYSWTSLKGLGHLHASMLGFSLKVALHAVQMQGPITKSTPIFSEIMIINVWDCQVKTTF